MAEVIKVFNEKDLFVYLQHLRLLVAKKVNDQNIEDSKNVTEEKKTFSGVMKNIGNTLKRGVNDYEGKSEKIDADLKAFDEKEQQLITENDALELVDNLFNDDTKGLTKLVFACTVILDNEYEYKYAKEGLEEVSNVLFGNKEELLDIKKKLEDNYNAISPTSLTSVQKGVLIGAAAVSLAGMMCLPTIIGAGAATGAALAAHGFSSLGVLTFESLLVSAALTGMTYAGMKIYNEQKVRAEFKNMSPEKNALYLAIQVTHIQRLSQELCDFELKEQLDAIFKNMNAMKGDLDYFLFVEKESTKENKQKMKSFHDFDNRLIKVLEL